MSIIKRIIENGRAFTLPNENQFTTIKRYRAVPVQSAFFNGQFWQRIKL